MQRGNQRSGYTSITNDIYKPLEKEPQLEKSDKKDYIQELKELKELVDIGGITEEEFILKKKQILNIE